MLEFRSVFHDNDTHAPDTQIGNTLAILFIFILLLCFRSFYNLLFRHLPHEISDATLPFRSFLYSNILPNRSMSRLMRPLTQRTIPFFIREHLYRFFGHFYPIQWHEFKKDLNEYPTFHDFFTRRLESQRKLHDTDLCSPCDGTVVAFGKIDEETQTLEQVKGVRFKLKQFLFGYDSDEQSKINLDEIKKKDGFNLYYSIIYLAPGDYHRFHSPADDIKIDTINHIVGDLYPVKPSWLSTVPGLFVLNERIVLSGTWKRDLFFSYVPVGAFNIGSIHLKDEPLHRTSQSHQDLHVWYRQKRNAVGSHSHSCNAQKCLQKFGKGEELLYDKGDEIGFFSFGSTVVVIWEAPNFEFYIRRNQKIKFGEPLGDIVWYQSNMDLTQKAL